MLLLTAREVFWFHLTVSELEEQRSRLSGEPVSYPEVTTELSRAAAIPQFLPWILLPLGRSRSRCRRYF